jgi:hypothetical protein
MDPATNPPAAEPAPAETADEKPLPLIALLRKASRVEAALLMQRYNEAFDCFGPFDPCPVDPSNVVTVHQRAPAGTLSVKQFRVYELTQRDEHGVKRTTGYVLAKNWGDFKRFADKVLGITILGTEQGDAG